MWELVIAALKVAVLAYALGRAVSWLMGNDKKSHEHDQELMTAARAMHYMPSSSGRYTGSDMQRLGLGDCHGGCSGVGSRPAMTEGQNAVDQMRRVQAKADGDRRRMEERIARGPAEFGRRDSDELPAHGHSRSTGLEIPIDWEIPDALGSERPSVEVGVEAAQWIQVQ